MLRRCIPRLSTCWQVRPTGRVPSFRVRHQSTTPERTSQQAPNRHSSQTQGKSNGKLGYAIAATASVALIAAVYNRDTLLSTRPTDGFESYTLVSKDPISSTASIFTVKPQRSTLHTEDFAQARKTGVWNVHFKQPQLQIIRAYTPLPQLDDADPTKDADTLRFLIRRDAQGEVSSYLHRLPVGSNIEMRGPNVEYQLPKHTKNVIFIAGGTGIAPAMQVAHAMFDGSSEAERHGKSLHILWANRRKEDCAGATSTNIAQTPASSSASWSSWLLSPFVSQTLVTPTIDPATTSSQPRTEGVVLMEEPNAIVSHLTSLQTRHQSSLCTSYFIDEENTFITPAALESAVSSLPNPEAAASGKERTQTQIIISGPPGFISYLAGPKVWREGKEQQGPLGGILEQVLAKQGRKEEVKVWKV